MVLVVFHQFLLPQPKNRSRAYGYGNALTLTSLWMSSGVAQTMKTTTMMISTTVAFLSLLMAAELGGADWIVSIDGLDDDRALRVLRDLIVWRRRDCLSTFIIITIIIIITGLFCRYRMSRISRNTQKNDRHHMSHRLWWNSQRKRKWNLRRNSRNSVTAAWIKLFSRFHKKSRLDYNYR